MEGIPRNESMRDSLARNPQVISNMIAKAKRNPKAAESAFIFVEGPADRRAFSAFVSVNTQLIVAHGRGNVGECVRNVNAQNVRGACGIEDADCDRLLGRRPLSKNLFLTDGHDVEAMMIESPALEKVLRELADADKVMEFESIVAPIRDVLKQGARPIGVLKYLKVRGGLKGLDISTRDLAYADFIDAETLSCDLSAMCRYFADRSSGGPSATELQAAVTSTDLSCWDDWDVCRGHDLVGVLAVGLSGALGSRRVYPSTVEQSLRLAFDSLAFCRTSLCRQLADYERLGNGSGRFLADDVRVIAQAFSG